MYHCRAVNLLEAIGAAQQVATAFTGVRDADGSKVWLVCAVSEDGQQWRSQHADFLLAVVMLEKLMAQVDNAVGASRSSECR